MNFRMRLLAAAILLCTVSDVFSQQAPQPPDKDPDAEPILRISSTSTW